MNYLRVIFTNESPCRLNHSVSSFRLFLEFIIQGMFAISGIAADSWIEVPEAGSRPKRILDLRVITDDPFVAAI